MAYSPSRNERVYLLAESSFGVPATAGAVSLAAARATRFTKCELTGAVGMVTRPDKTGVRSNSPGIAGPRTGTWGLPMSLAPGASAGVVPDCDLILKSLFGQVGTVVTSTSVTYTLEPTDIVYPSFSLWNFRSPSSVLQRAAIGCLAKTMRVSFGSDILAAEFGGPCLWVLDNEQYATIPDGDPGKGGMTTAGQPAWPVEPSPSYNGAAMTGFKGSILVDSQTIAEFQSGEISLDTGVELRRAFGSDYSTIVGGGDRSVSVSFKVFDGDSTALKNLRAKAISKTAVDAVFTAGTVAGSRYEFTVRGIQLAVPGLSEDGPYFAMQFSSSPASIAAATPNEVQVKIF